MCGRKEARSMGKLREANLHRVEVQLNGVPRETNGPDFWEEQQ